MTNDINDKPDLSDADPRDPKRDKPKLGTTDPSELPKDRPDSGTDKPHDLRREFKVQVDKDIVEIPTSHPTGRELLEFSGKKPAEHYAIYLKVKGGQPKRIGLDEKIDLGQTGVERFVTLPLDQTEGFGGRRQFSLPEEDIEWLDNTWERYELVAEGGDLRVVLYDFPIPLGYRVRQADVNVRIETGYPDTQIDMVYVHPVLERTDGRSIAAIASDQFDGKQWQRWSRHRTPANPWRPGVDNLATHFGLVEHWFQRELSKG